jgi:hypothetical protein
MPLHDRIWCSECRLRVALAEPTEFFRNNLYHKRCLMKRRLLRAKAAAAVAESNFPNTHVPAQSVELERDDTVRSS